MPSSSPSLPLDATETPTTTAAPPKKRASKKPTTEKPPPDPRTAVIFHALEELQGYKFDRGSSPRTMKAIRTMLDEGHEPDAIIGCWRKLKAGFWSDKFLELAVVAKYLGEYETGNMARAAPTPYRNGAGPPAATPRASPNLSDFAVFGSSKDYPEDRD